MSGSRNTAAGVAPQEWTSAFAVGSAEAFGAGLTEEVVLEATALLRPLRGREAVGMVLAAASGVYESLVFTHQAVCGPQTYLEWEGTAFGGVGMRGVTVLSTNEAGLITRAAIHHRPLGPLLRFSAELGRRLAGAAAADHFYQEKLS